MLFFNDISPKNRIKFSTHPFPTVPLLESKGILHHILPIHDSKDLSFLKNIWVKKFWKSQPLSNIVFIKEKMFTRKLRKTFF